MTNHLKLALTVAALLGLPFPLHGQRLLAPDKMALELPAVSDTTVLVMASWRQRGNPRAPVVYQWTAEYVSGAWSLAGETPDLTVSFTVARDTIDQASTFCVQGYRARDDFLTDPACGGFTVPAERLQPLPPPDSLEVTVDTLAVALLRPKPDAFPAQLTGLALVRDIDTGNLRTVWQPVEDAWKYISYYTDQPDGPHLTWAPETGWDIEDDWTGGTFCTEAQDENRNFLTIESCLAWSPGGQVRGPIPPCFKEGGCPWLVWCEATGGSWSSLSACRHIGAPNG